MAQPGPGFWGAKRERSEQKWGSRGLPPEKFLGTTPLRCLQNEGNALFSYILHHKHDYIEHQIGMTFCSIWIKNLYSKLLRKQKNSYAITRVQHIKYEIRNGSSQLYCRMVWCWCWSLDLDFRGTVSFHLSLSCQSAASFARIFCKRNCSSAYRFFK